jgi:hypothetical protein
LKNVAINFFTASLSFFYHNSSEKQSAGTLTADNSLEKQSAGTLTTAVSQEKQSAGTLTTAISQEKQSASAFTTDRRNLRQSAETLTTGRRNPRQSAETLTTGRRNPRQSAKTLTTDRRNPRQPAKTLTTDRRNLRQLASVLRTDRRNLRQSVLFMSIIKPLILIIHNIISQIKFMSYYYRHFNWKKFETWGTKEYKPNMSVDYWVGDVWKADWEMLGDYEFVKHSGSPMGVDTAEDTQLSGLLRRNDPFDV